MIPFTIEFESPEVEAPVYLAGTFSKPPWHPQKMQSVPGLKGRRMYTAQVYVEPGTAYQYKFKVGEQQQWTTNHQKPTTREVDGNEVNVLNVPQEQTSMASTKDGHTFATRGITVSVPVPISDGGKHRTQNEYFGGPRVLSEADDNLDDFDLSEPLQTPLFAHEGFGAYEFVDDCFDHGLSGSLETCGQLGLGSKAGVTATLDVNDPSIEKFPCEKTSIMSALRKIQSSTSDDMILTGDMPMSPQMTSRRTSVDSADDLLSQGSLSPTSTRKRDSRLSHSSFGRTKSAVSLGSIAEEEPRPGVAGAPRLPVTPPRGQQSTRSEGNNSPATDDEMFMMRT